MRRARWRKDPATKNQKKFVESRWNKAPKCAQGRMANDGSRDLHIQSLTKGEAANIITRIKHGAMVPSDLCDLSAAELTLLAESIRGQGESDEERGTTAVEGAQEAGTRSSYCGSIGSPLIHHAAALVFRLFTLKQTAPTCSHRLSTKTGLGDPSRISPASYSRVP